MATAHYPDYVACVVGQIMPLHKDRILDADIVENMRMIRHPLLLYGPGEAVVVAN